MAGTKAGALKRKDEAQKRLEAKFGAKSDPTPAGTSYVVGARPLQWHGYTLEPGTLVPDAHEWPRLEAWTRAKRIVPAYGDVMTEAQPEQTDNRPQDDDLEDVPQDDADYSADLTEELA